MMKLSRVFVTAMLVGTLAMCGCGDDSGGGGGDTDPDNVCAGCTTQPAREDCENDLLICGTFTDPGAREACIAGAADNCI